MSKKDWPHRLPRNDALWAKDLREQKRRTGVSEQYTGLQWISDELRRHRGIRYTCDEIDAALRDCPPEIPDLSGQARKFEADHLAWNPGATAVPLAQIQARLREESLANAVPPQRRMPDPLEEDPVRAAYDKRLRDQWSADHPGERCPPIPEMLKRMRDESSSGGPDKKPSE